MTCPLCGSPSASGFVEVRDEQYFRCAECGLVFLHPELVPVREEERARYEQHRNDPADARYRAFLDRLARPLIERLPAGAHGLDYGSGPGPTLSLMLEERGFIAEVYDPFFAPDHSVLTRRYDFVTCSETAEHFHRPGEEFDRLHRLLRPGGWLAVMTGVLEDGVDFETWWYARDPTHVSFYSPRTLRWLAERHGWTLERPGVNVALFRKGSGGTPP